MKSDMFNGGKMSRRSMLRAAGVAIALPMLDFFQPRRVSAAEQKSPARMIAICASLGLHAPYLFPKEKDTPLGASPYLDLIKDHRDDFTLFSGLSHPEQSGADGHSSQMTWLTAAQHPGLAGFRNSISLDQFIAEKIGLQTRLPSLVLGTSGVSQSFTRGGVMINAERHPSRVFAKLFLQGSDSEVKEQVRKLREGRSIMDAVRDQATRFSNRVGAADREKLDEYFTSVREMEQRLAKAQEWANKPKPKVDAAQPQDVANDSDLIGKLKLVFDLIPLALQTDSTRVVTVLIEGRNDVPPVKGVSIDHHNLSHHGQDPEKIGQLRLVEEEEMKCFGKLLADLKAKKDATGALLDSTTVLFGSNLGNANAHDTRNLPILLAGGGFKHGRHIGFDEKNNKPLSDLFVTMIQRMGVEADKFGSSKGSITI